MLRAHDIAAKAAELVGGDRAKTHGSKLENHSNIARLWTAYGRNAGWLVGDLSALDVANLMECLKIARRQAGAHNPDDYIDGAGYASVAGEIAETLEMQRAVVAAAARSAACSAPGRIVPIDDGADAPGEGLVAEKPEDWVVRSTTGAGWLTTRHFVSALTLVPALALRMSRAEAQRIASEREFLVAEPASTLPAAKPAAA